ncbi:MAG: hypothetical protein IIB55_07535, partial [Planctomycetes bacterium]|nr:hypothetical protein [Planctomycetota bacterium]
MTDVKSMDKIMALCKRRGFIYQASEIYGGINGFWDYGPLGAQLKKNLRDAWWEDVVMTGCRGATGPNGRPVRIVPLDTCIIQNPKVWEASGHVGGFNDPMVDDKETKQRFRADHLQGIFPICGGTFPVDEVAEMVMRDFESNWKHQVGAGVPIATIVASNEHEALDILEQDKKMQKLLRTKVLKTFKNESEPAAVVVYDLGQGNLQGAVVKAVPSSTLRDNAESVPSPFTGKFGSLTPPRQFNLMFYSYAGATATEG